MENERLKHRIDTLRRRLRGEDGKRRISRAQAMEMIAEKMTARGMTPEVAATRTRELIDGGKGVVRRKVASIAAESPG